MSLLPASLLLALSTPQAPAQDWPQYGGPHRDNRIDAIDTQFDWGEGGPEVLWRTPTGPGFGGAAIHGGEVFLFDCELGEADVLRAFDLSSGEEKWSAAYEAPGRNQFPGSRSVPAVTAEAVYTAGGFGHVACFDRASGEILWMEHLGETYGGEQPMFGWSSSPLLVDDLVIHSVLGEDVGLVAFDRMSGEEEWVSEGLGYSHSTPTLLNLHGKRQLVFLSTPGQASGLDQAAPMRISALDPANGELLWQHTLTLTRLPIPTAVQIDDERVFLTGGYRGGSTMLRITEQDGGYAFEELFHIERGAQVHQPLLLDDHLYVLVNENWNDARNRRSEGGLMCLTLDGKELWRTKDDPYFGRGHALLAGGHLLIQDGFDGTLRVVRANPKAYEQVAEINLFPDNSARDGQMWAPMAVANGHLVMRSQDELLCLRL